MALLQQIPEEEKIKGVVLTGDLIDRGPKSADVVQFCIDNSDTIKVVMGNHEQMMAQEGLERIVYLEKNGMGNILNHTLPISGNNIWLANGGLETVSSYINKFPAHSNDNNIFKKVLDLEKFTKHQEWMKNLPLYLEFKDVKNDKGEHLLVTHSSACRVWKWPEERRKNQYKHFKENIIWGRPNNITPIVGIYNVFGHTPVSPIRIKTSYANIDSGCCYYKKPDYFKLTALQFPEMIIYEQENIDMEEEL